MCIGGNISELKDDAIFFFIHLKARKSDIKVIKRIYFSSIGQIFAFYSLLSQLWGQRQAE